MFIGFFLPWFLGFQRCWASGEENWLAVRGTLHEIWREKLGLWLTAPKNLTQISGLPRPKKSTPCFRACSLGCPPCSQWLSCHRTVPFFIGRNKDFTENQCQECKRLEQNIQWGKDECAWDMSQELALVEWLLARQSRGAETQGVRILKGKISPQFPSPLAQPKQFVHARFAMISRAMVPVTRKYREREAGREIDDNRVRERERKKEKERERKRKKERGGAIHPRSLQPPTHNNDLSFWYISRFRGPKIVEATVATTKKNTVHELLHRGHQSSILFQCWRGPKKGLFSTLKFCEGNSSQR